MTKELAKWQKILITIPMVLISPLISLYYGLKCIANSKPKQNQPIHKGNRFKQFAYNNWLSNKENAQNNRIFVLFLLPTLFAFTLFVITPFVQGLYLSFTNWNGLNNGRERFVGLINYESMFNDSLFYYAIFRTIIYAVLNVIVINLVAFGLALLTTQNTKLKNVYRAGFFLPNLIGGLVLGYIWQFIFNRALVKIGGAFATSFIVNPDTAMFALIAVVTWQYAGYIMMIYIAAIQNVPQDLVEASKIDGASPIQRLKAVTLPLIRQAFTVASFLTLVTSFKQFDTVQSLTQAGPFGLFPSWLAELLGISAETSVRTLTLIAVNIYETAFAQNNLAAGQAKAIVFFFFLLLISLMQVYFNKKKEVEM